MRNGGRVFEQQRGVSARKWRRSGPLVGRGWPLLRSPLSSRRHRRTSCRGKTAKILPRSNGPARALSSTLACACARARATAYPSRLTLLRAGSQMCKVAAADGHMLRGPSILPPLHASRGPQSPTPAPHRERLEPGNAGTGKVVPSRPTAHWLLLRRPTFQGPTLVVTEGDWVTVTVRNRLPAHTNYTSIAVSRREAAWRWHPLSRLHVPLRPASAPDPLARHRPGHVDQFRRRRWRDAVCHPPRPPARLLVPCQLAWHVLVPRAQDRALPGERCARWELGGVPARRRGAALISRLPRIGRRMASTEASSSNPCRRRPSSPRTTTTGS